MTNKIQFETWLSKDKCRKLQERFGSYDEFKSNPNKENKKPIFEAVDALLDKREGSLELLEVGCGPGHFLWSFKDQVSKIIGLDYSVEMLKLAEKQLKKADVDSEFIKGSCWDLPLLDNSVDISLQVDVCMHIGGSWDSIKEMIRVSKKYVVFTGVSFEEFTDNMDRKIAKMSWAISVPLLEKKLNKLISQNKICSFRYVDRPRSKTYDHRILVIEI